MDRPYKDMTWQELLKARDSFQTICDLGNFPEYEEFERINDEIDYRYKNNKREG